MKPDMKPAKERHEKTAEPQITFADIGKCLRTHVETAPLERTRLFELWDKATRTALSRTNPELNATVEQGLKTLSAQARKPLLERDIPQTMEKMRRFHSRIAKLTEPDAQRGAHEPEALPAKDFEQFYSLVYYALPKHKQFDADREALLQVLDSPQLKLRLQPEETVKKNFDAIVALGEKRIGQGRN